MKSGSVGIRKQVIDKVDGLSPAWRGLLLVAVVLCALSVVTSQHKARKLFIELQKEKEQAQQRDVEWGQLQLEQSTWAAPARVEQVAVQRLQMQLPKNGQVQFIRIKQPSPQSSPTNGESEARGAKPSDRPISREMGEKNYNGSKPQQ
jgi:cell division protein FtsL